MTQIISTVHSSLCAYSTKNTDLRVRQEFALGYIFFTLLNNLLITKGTRSSSLDRLTKNLRMSDLGAGTPHGELFEGP